MPEEILELTVDKFTFRVPKGLYYSDAGVWVKLEGEVARLGLSDFTQQRSGDVAFAEVRPAGPTPFRVPHEAGDAGAARPLSRRSGPGPARPAPTHLSLASVPELSAEPTPLPAPHDPRVATWLRRAPLMAARLWRSFRSQTR